MNATTNSTLVVTQVQVFPIINAEGKLKAFARVLLNDELLLTSLRVYEGSKGLFVSYPNDPMHKGDDYRQLFYPVTKDLRVHIEEVILKEFKDAADRL
jgi:stage V sporulation protein G